MSDGDEVQQWQARLRDGLPDNRGLPTIRIVCEGRPDKGTGHKRIDIAVFSTEPFDLAKGTAANWFWNSDLATGGGRVHSTTRIREDKSKRAVTKEEVDQGRRPGFTEASPKRYVGSAEIGGHLHFNCAKCPNDLHMTAKVFTDILDKFLLGTEKAGPYAALLHAAQGQLSLNGLIALSTKPKAR